MQRTLTLVTAILLLCALFPASLTARAAAADYDIPNGHFYTQAAGPTAASGTGFAIENAGQDERGQTITFWSEFQRLGGVAKLGYPASNRFMLDGFWTQATQRVLMQWRPEVKQVYFVNVFDKLHDLGLDPQLQAKYQVPAPVTVNDAGKPFSQVVAERQAYLNANPAIKQAYFSVSDPLQLNGLPTSQITDAGGVFEIIRSQRIVIQYWKKSIPGVANAGDVTVGLGGDIAKEFGVVPLYASTPIPVDDADQLSQLPTSARQGEIIFGDDYTDTGSDFVIVHPKPGFPAGATIAYSAYLAELPNTTVIQRTISRVALTGAETLVSTADRNLSDPEADLLAGKLITQPSLAPGLYRMRYIRNGKTLAEGVFGIQSSAQVQPPAQPNPPQSPPSNPTSYPIGTKLHAGTWEYTITDVKANRAVYDGSGGSRVAKGFYVIVFATITNIGSGTDAFWQTEPVIVDGQGRQYSEDGAAEVDAKYQFGKDWDLADTNPGVTRQIVLVFDVSPDATNLLFGTTDPLSGPVQLGSPRPPQ